jgi:ribosomal protein S18 acetylase RimI-like enzyme
MISKATLDDATELEFLINSAYRGESSKIGWTTEANLLEGKRTTAQELQDIIENDKSNLLKYTDNHQILGCVLLIEKKDELYLGMLTVMPTLQNSGIGKKLMQQAEVVALEKNLSKIVMTVISVRTELIAWYERKGYEDTGERKPFPESEDYTTVSENPLEFIVLEKKIIT